MATQIFRGTHTLVVLVELLVEAAHGSRGLKSQEVQCVSSKCALKPIPSPALEKNQALNCTNGSENCRQQLPEPALENELFRRCPSMFAMLRALSSPNVIGRNHQPSILLVPLCLWRLQ